MPSDFLKRLDDLLHQELSLLGYDYSSVVAALEDTRGGTGAFVRLLPPYEDFQMEEPEGEMDETFAARVRRRLRVAIEAPDRPPSPE